MKSDVGKVYLIGAGPGDPGLITLRAIEMLESADVVLYDYLANPAVLDHAGENAELVCLGRHGHGRLLSQDEINSRMVAAAQSGKRVVRLKCGDPAVFARTAQETEALESANVPFEIVPGVTAALAVGSYAGVSLTHRENASAVALVTGQETDAKQKPAIDYARLASFPGTIVVYMGVTTAEHWTSQLIAGGRSADTPATIVRRCSWPNQVTYPCTLGTVATVLAENRVRPPAIVIVGDVAGEVSESTWFTERPLFGRRVVVTRPASQTREIRKRLAELGADVLIQPAIEITAPDDWSPVDDAIQRIDEFDWLVFSSANGVRFFVDRLTSLRGDVRPLAAVKIAAIGTRTSEALAEYHLCADLVPDEFRAESLADSLVSADGAAGKKFLLVRASRGREILAETLTAARAEVEQIVVYRSTDVTSLDNDIAAAFDERSIDWITVSSSAIARSLVALAGERLNHCRMASISPITSDTLRELGFEPAAEAKTYTMDGIVEAILEAEQEQ